MEEAMTDLHRRTRTDVDAHFAGRIDRDGERRMRRHLFECEDCSTYYAQMRLFAAIDPDAPSSEERLLAGLGVERPRARSLPMWLFGGLATAAVCALLLVVALPREPETGLAPRGEAHADIVARVLADGAASPIGDSLASDAELAFGYANPEGWKRLLVFAVDEHGHVFWYHPAWTRAEDDPRAVAIQRTDDAVELPSAARHGFDGERLTLYAVFTNEAPTVREVERLVGMGGVDSLGRVIARQVRIDR
jgi:hypothetical protein